MKKKHNAPLFSMSKRAGFTIVELLIVVVIVGILATLSTTVYAGVSGRSYDTSVQNDLSAIAKKMKLYHAEHGVYPITAQLPSLGLRVNKSAYGSHYDNGEATYNLLYCRIPAAAPTQFALVAYSRSGTGYQYSSGGQLSKYTGPKTGTGPMCTSAGVATSGLISDRDWLYFWNSWQPYVGG